MLGNQTQPTEMTESLSSKEKKALSDKKYRDKMKSHPEYEKKQFIKNTLKGNRKKLDDPEYKPTKPSIDKWNRLNITAEDIEEELFEKWSKLFQKTNDELIEKSKPPVCLITDTDDEDEGKEETKENFVEPKEEPKEDPLDFLDGLSDEFYQFATTKEEGKKPFDNREFAKYIETFDTIGLELAKQYIQMKLKYPWDNRFIYNVDKKVYFTSEDVKTYIENRTDCVESTKKIALNYYQKKEDYFTSDDLYVDSPFVNKILPNKNFRESIKKFLTYHDYHTRTQFKEVYKYMEEYRIDEKYKKDDETEKRNLTQKLPVTYDQIIDMVENKLTDENEIIANRLFHINCPLRNDFCKINLGAEFCDSGNFIDFEKNKLFIYPKKTGKIYGQLEYDIDDKTMKLIKESYEKQPRKFLFSSSFDTDFPMIERTCSRLLRDPIERFFDVKVTISNLRAIHETHANRENPDGTKVLSNKERDEHARKMAHTRTVADKHYVRKQSIETIKE